MSDERALLDELRHDFVERNTALFMLLGILSAGERLKRTLASGQPAAGGHTAGSHAKVDYLTLGLIALGEQVAAMAVHFAEALPECEPRGEFPPVDGDLMR